jgi:hypothetical protein
MESKPSSTKFKFSKEAKKAFSFVLVQVTFSRVTVLQITNGPQADKHIIENWSNAGFDRKQIKFPGEACLASKEVPWSSNRFELERYLRDNDEAERKVGTSSFLLFQSKLYCDSNAVARANADS